MILKNAQERYEETKRNQLLILQGKVKALGEFWQSELGEFLINEIENYITSESEQGFSEAQIKFHGTIWNKLDTTFPNKTLPSSRVIIYDVVAMYEDKGFEVDFWDGSMPRLIIKWDNANNNFDLIEVKK